MNNTLDMLLADLGDNMEFTVQPSDNRFEAAVTVYPDEAREGRTYRAKDSSAKAALTAALLLANGVRA